MSVPSARRANRTQPLAADALVIGAGPAGCAAATILARQGADVILADRSEFPREKTCGDALIPDALAALDRLGLRERVLALARAVREIRLYAPGGREVILSGECAVLGRRVFDNVLRQAAVEAGARFIAPYRAIEPIHSGGRCAGARFRHHRDAATLDVMARWTILATGGAGESLRAFGVGERLEASATAARIYLRVPEGMTDASNVLAMSFERNLLPGYGWMFPAPDNTFNVGVLVFHDASRPTARPNLRVAMARFLETFAPARAASLASVSRTRLVGAPLRTALTGTRFAVPGVLVAGEAAGTTYSLIAEGIGKALETGVLAATTVAEALDARLSATAVGTSYAARIESAYRDRFDAYQRAQRYAGHPVVANMLAWRANAGSFVRAQLEGMFNETTHPRTLFSASGLVRSVFQ